MQLLSPGTPAHPCVTHDISAYCEEECVTAPVVKITCYACVMIQRTYYHNWIFPPLGVREAYLFKGCSNRTFTFVNCYQNTLIEQSLSTSIQALIIKLVEPLVCSDNQKVGTIKPYTEPCSITLIELTPYVKYSNRTVIATVRITKSSVNLMAR